MTTKEKIQQAAQEAFPEPYGLEAAELRYYKDLMAAGQQGYTKGANDWMPKWVPVSEPPKEVGRYWCYVEEYNDLGRSHYQWNCSWNPHDNRWGNLQSGHKVLYWTNLMPEPPTQENR